MVLTSTRGPTGLQEVATARQGQLKKTDFSPLSQLKLSILSRTVVLRTRTMYNSVRPHDGRSFGRCWAPDAQEPFSLAGSRQARIGSHCGGWPITRCHRLPGR